jgi:hypothetical protein
MNTNTVNPARISYDLSIFRSDPLPFTCYLFDPVTHSIQHSGTFSRLR